MSVYLHLFCTTLVDLTFLLRQPLPRYPLHELFSSLCTVQTDKASYQPALELLCCAARNHSALMQGQWGSQELSSPMGSPIGEPEMTGKCFSLHFWGRRPEMHFRGLLQCLGLTSWSGGNSFLHWFSIFSYGLLLSLNSAPWDHYPNKRAACQLLSLFQESQARIVWKKRTN